MPYMLRLTWQGVALHGGHLPGYPASHGCIRLPHEFAPRVFETVRLGDLVMVVRHGLPSGALADVLREALGGNGTRPGTSWIVLAVWAAVTPLLAARLFRWD